MLLSEEYTWYKNNEELLNDEGLNRFETHLNNGNVIAFISGVKKDNTIIQNEANNLAVEALIKGAGFGYHLVEGSNGDNEYSNVCLGIYCSPELEDTLYRLVQGVAKKFNQEGFVFAGKSTKRTLCYYSIDGKVINEFTQIKDVMQSYISTLGKKSFEFNQLSPFSMPYGGNNSGLIIVSRNRKEIETDGVDNYINNRLLLRGAEIYL